MTAPRRKKQSPKLVTRVDAERPRALVASPSPRPGASATTPTRIPTAAELCSRPDWRTWLEAAVRDVLGPVAVASAMSAAAMGCGTSPLDAFATAVPTTSLPAVGSAAHTQGAHVHTSLVATQDPTLATAQLAKPSGGPVPFGPPSATLTPISRPNTPTPITPPLGGAPMPVRPSPSPSPSPTPPPPRPHVRPPMLRGEAPAIRPEPVAPVPGGMSVRIDRR